MQSTILALGAFAGLAAAWGNSSYGVYTTTEVVSSYTTVCPGPTSVVEGNVTYTATSVSLLFQFLILGWEHGNRKKRHGTTGLEMISRARSRSQGSTNANKLFSRPPP